MVHRGTQGGQGPQQEPQVITRKGGKVCAALQGSCVCVCIYVSLHVCVRVCRHLHVHSCTDRGMFVHKTSFTLIACAAVLQERSFEPQKQQQAVVKGTSCTTTKAAAALAVQVHQVKP